jgi:hypothetical protein
MDSATAAVLTFLTIEAPFTAYKRQFYWSGFGGAKLFSPALFESMYAQHRAACRPKGQQALRGLSMT